jgi:hypothetical protein
MADPRPKPDPYPEIINVSGYKDTTELYATSSGPLKTGNGGGFRLRNGLAITVTIPPTLRAFRYPNLSASGQSTPYISDDDRVKLQDRRNWQSQISFTNHSLTPAQLFKRNSPYATPAPYYTKLSGTKTTGEEKRFRDWVKSEGIPYNLDPKLLATQDYDMRGYWKATHGAHHKRGTHFPDTFKTPYHQSFSNQSKYALPNCPFVWYGNTLVDLRTSSDPSDPSKAAVIYTDRSTPVTERSLGIKRNSSEFEISDFVTSLSWGSTMGNSFIELSIGLDNMQGMFNYLPEGAKITVWRRKSLSNTTSGSPYGGKWYRYIVAYVANKTRTASARNMTMDLTCRDRLGYAGVSKVAEGRKWNKDTKAHKNGWSAKEITIQICKEFGLPYDATRLPTKVIVKKVTKKTVGTGKNKKVVKKVTYPTIPLPRLTKFEPNENDIATVISLAWKQSIAKLAKKYQLPWSLHMRQGVLVFEFVGAPGNPYTQVTDPELKKHGGFQRLVPHFDDDTNIESGTLDESIDGESVWTELQASGTHWNPKDKKNKKGKHIGKPHKIKGTFLPFADNAEKQALILQAYGKRVQKKRFKKHVFASAKEFRTAAQAVIDKAARPVRTLTIEGRAPLGMWPAYYVHVNSRYLGVNGNVVLESVNYTVDNGLIGVSITVIVESKHFTRIEEETDQYSKKFKPPRDIWY